VCMYLVLVPNLRAFLFIGKILLYSSVLVNSMILVEYNSMSSRGRSTVLDNGMTLKQDRFVAHLLTDFAKTGKIKPVDAALATYDTTSRSIANGIAGENLNKPIIRKNLQAILSGSGLKLDEILSEVKDLAHAKVKEVSGDTKLRSLVELLKLHNAYPSNKNTVLGHSTVINVQQISFTEAKEKLKQSHVESAALLEDLD